MYNEEKQAHAPRNHRLHLYPLSSTLCSLPSYLALGPETTERVPARRSAVEKLHERRYECKTKSAPRTANRTKRMHLKVHSTPSRPPYKRSPASHNCKSAYAIRTSRDGQKEARAPLYPSQHPRHRPSVRPPPTTPRPRSSLCSVHRGPRVSAVVLAFAGRRVQVCARRDLSKPS